MFRATNQRPLIAYFEAIKGLRLRQLALTLKAGFDPNLLINGRGQNGLQFMIQYFNGSESNLMRLELPGARSIYIRIAKLLLDAGLDPNSTDLLTGESVIFDAIRLNDRELIALLLHYVDLSLRNKDGETAFMCAARYATVPTMRLLLGHLSELELDEIYLRQRNRFGFTALDLARAENLECAKLLTKHLIALDQPITPYIDLRRSSSHHQLGLAHHGPGGSSSLMVKKRNNYSGYGLDDALNFSDPESDHQPANAIWDSSSTRRFKHQQDLRAATFNRYLMDRRDMATTLTGTGWTSDETDEEHQTQFGCDKKLPARASFKGTSSPTGGLYRSRSSTNLQNNAPTTSSNALDDAFRKQRFNDASVAVQPGAASSSSNQKFVSCSSSSNKQRQI